MAKPMQRPNCSAERHTVPYDGSRRVGHFLRLGDLIGMDIINCRRAGAVVDHRHRHQAEMDIFAQDRAGRSIVFGDEATAETSHKS